MDKLKPKVGLLALTLELYEELAPALRGEREKWVRDRMIPAMSSFADVRFSRAASRREEIDQVVAEYEAAKVDVLMEAELRHGGARGLPVELIDDLSDVVSEQRLDDFEHPRVAPVPVENRVEI